MENAETTKQVNIFPPNPTGKGGFGDHPEHRNDGRWSKENSFKYWLNYFKSLSVEEFINYEKTKTNKERTIAESLAYTRIAKARIELREFQEVANRTEGMSTNKTEVELAYKGVTEFTIIQNGLSKGDKNSLGTDGQAGGSVEIFNG